MNQGGMELLGRATAHSLLAPESQEKARVTCERLFLDGLIVVGSSLAMTEAARTAEYFLARSCRTAVIGIPATGSNNLLHDLIETNIGFDTSSKVWFFRGLSVKTVTPNAVGVMRKRSFCF